MFTCFQWTSTPDSSTLIHPAAVLTLLTLSLLPPNNSDAAALLHHFIASQPQIRFTMAAIHNLSDSLQDILIGLSEKVEKLTESNAELESRTKDLEAREIEMKSKIEDLEVQNTTLQERATVLEKQLNTEVESKLQDLIQHRHDTLENRLTIAESRLMDHDKLIDRLESCEKKLASFYGDDTNILGRVGFLETRFKDFKANEDAKLKQVLDNITHCKNKIEGLQDRVTSLEENLNLIENDVNDIREAKLNAKDIGTILTTFKIDNKLLDEDSIADIIDISNKNKESIVDISQLLKERDEQISDWLEKVRNDIEELQRNTEPAHKYECFGSDQSVKIYQLEAKLKDLEGMTAASIDSSLERMKDQIAATSSQMDRVLNIESFITSNFDRIGTDYVHMSRLISDINEELNGKERKIQEIEKGLRTGVKVQEIKAPDDVNDSKLQKLAKDIERIEQMMNSADYRISAFADECKNSFHDIQDHNDRKIDILAVWVSKNINLLASKTRKKFKQLLAGDNWALLSGQSKRPGHCLSCNQSQRPHSASHPRTVVTEGKKPLFKITHVEKMEPNGAPINDEDLYSDVSDGIGSSFKMTVPASLRTTVSQFRQSNNESPSGATFDPLPDEMQEHDDHEKKIKSM